MEKGVSFSSAVDHDVGPFWLVASLGDYMKRALYSLKYI
jgi:hypothetical protein